jgi:hypothetical protein
MTDTGRQSSLTSFIFGKQKQRDDGDKENQPELAEKRQKMDWPARHKQRIRKKLKSCQSSLIFYCKIPSLCQSLAKICQTFVGHI